ncbi:GlcG/HbpS family heme-binding protein [Defluviimonas sp. SAOS-178_SWC]|uniref:GlcG/HbpS family heme-binding protein n=1 Tax=Defluviimonas sp. SAOS-178_SWC TaxID=3121287 RepID=UPI003221A66B
MPELQLQPTLDAIAVGLKVARAMDVRCSIAVLDSGRNLLAFARGNEASLGTIELARNKAYTAASFRMKTSVLAGVSQPGQPLYGLDVSGDGALVIFGGGVPIMLQDRSIGAVGVSGGTVEQDEQIADAVAAEFSR